MMPEDSETTKNLAPKVNDVGASKPEPLPAEVVFQRMPDRGPRYTETPVDPSAPDAPAIAEPYNAVTASFFVFIALYWLFRLRGRFRQHPMVTACMPILLVGGVGGTLYHAYRTRFTYFLLDVVPIQLLGFAAAIYLTIRLGKDYGLKRVLGIAVGIVSANLLVNGVLFRMTDFGSRYPTLTVNLNYASLAIIILTPMAVVFIRTRFRHFSWVAFALASFAIAWFCRLIDPMSPLSMGTHWLWHIFGAITTAGLIAYFYRIEGQSFLDLKERRA